MQAGAEVREFFDVGLAIKPGAEEGSAGSFDMGLAIKPGAEKGSAGSFDGEIHSSVGKVLPKTPFRFVSRAYVQKKQRSFVPERLY